MRQPQAAAGAGARRTPARPEPRPPSGPADDRRPPSQAKKLVLQKVEGKGWGVFADEPIKEGVRRAGS